MKQNLFGRLAAAAVLLLSATTAMAHDFEVDGIFYNKDDWNKTASVTYKGNNYYDYDNVYSGAVTIPSEVTYEGTTYSVTAIGQSAFDSCSGLTKVVIPNSVTSIGNHAFFGCSGLTSVEIPNSVTSIGSYAFRGCSGLTTVVIPNSVTSIGSDAFSGCSGLESITVESGNTVYDSRDNCNAILETATNKLICGCKNTIIPNSVTSIGSYAFEGCSGLTSVEIPNSVTTIGYAAFRNCSGLTSVVIPNSVTSIGDFAFSGCSGLTSVVIPNSVTSIGNEAFCDCSGLTSVVIPNSVTSIGDDAFSCCSGLESITVESGNTVYDSRDNCNAILETATNSLICGCKNTIIPNSVTTIGNYAFYDCSGLTSVVIPNSVTSIGDFAFCYCSGLTSVTSLNIIPPTLDFQVFFGVPADCVLYVPKGCAGAYQSADGWKNFGTILEIQPGGVEGISKAETAKVRAMNGVIRVEGAKGARVEVYTTAGVCIYSGTDTEVPVPQRGLYVVKVAGRATKLAM